MSPLGSMGPGKVPPPAVRGATGGQIGSGGGTPSLPVTTNLADCIVVISYNCGSSTTGAGATWTHPFTSANGDIWVGRNASASQTTISMNGTGSGSGYYIIFVVSGAATASDPTRDKSLTAGNGGTTSSISAYYGDVVLGGAVYQGNASSTLAFGSWSPSQSNTSDYSNGFETADHCAPSRAVNIDISYTNGVATSFGLISIHH